MFWLIIPLLQIKSHVFFCIHLFILRYRFTPSSYSSFFLTTDPKFYKSKQTTVKLIYFQPAANAPLLQSLTRLRS